MDASYGDIDHPRDMGFLSAALAVCVIGLDGDRGTRGGATVSYLMMSCSRCSHVARIAHGEVAIEWGRCFE